MSDWAYCRRCDAGMARPTLRQLYEREQRCPNGHPQEPVGDVGEWLDDLERKVEWLTQLAREVGRDPPD